MKQTLLVVLALLLVATPALASHPMYSDRNVESQFRHRLYGGLEKPVNWICFRESDTYYVSHANRAPRIWTGQEVAPLPRPQCTVCGLTPAPVAQPYPERRHVHTPHAVCHHCTQCGYACENCSHKSGCCATKPHWQHIHGDGFKDGRTDFVDPKVCEMGSKDVARAQCNREFINHQVRPCGHTDHGTYDRPSDRVNRHLHGWRW